MIFNLINSMHLDGPKHYSDFVPTTSSKVINTKTKQYFPMKPASCNYLTLSLQSCERSSNAQKNNSNIATIKNHASAPKENSESFSHIIFIDNRI